MPKLKCQVEKCSYQKNQLCRRKTIDVEGISAHSKSETACLSYLPNVEDGLLEEYAAEFGPISSETNIYCDAINCVFERNSRCHADQIEIKPVEPQDVKNGKLRSGFWKSTDTMCLTFESKD